VQPPVGKQRKDMAVRAKVQDLVDAFDMQNEQSSSYLDRDTGEVYVITHDVLRIAEGGKDADKVRSDWEAEEVEMARRVLDSDRFVELPTSWDVHEWRIMEAFSYSLDDEDARADCLAAIHRRGAFRHFKDQLSRRGLLDSWYAFRGTALRKIAIEWCEEHEIAFQS
jgi:hypothetical protein